MLFFIKRFVKKKKIFNIYTVYYLFFYKFKLFFKENIMFLRKIFLLLLSAILFFIFGIKAFAYDTWFKIDSIIWNAVNLSWDKTLDTPYKWIYYWENEFDDPIDSEGETELIEWGNYAYRIDGLSDNTKYYFMLVWQNKNGEDVFISDVVSADIWDVSENNNQVISDFKLKEVEQVWVNQLKLMFTNDLDTEQKIENENFKIEDVSDSNNYLSVSNTKIDWDNIILNLNEKISFWVEYKLIVFNIIDTAWENIKNWIDAEGAFIWQEYTNLNTEDIIETSVEPVLNSAWKDGNKVNGQDMNKNEVNEDVLWAAEEKADNNKETETETWPNTIIFLIFVILVSSILFLPKHFKNIKN